MRAPDLLLDLLRARGPSGAETDAAEVWRRAARDLAAVTTDSLGSSVLRLPGDGGLTLALFGHIDEIGFTVAHVDERGYVAFVGIGSIDPAPLVGRSVAIRGRGGEWLPGVIGRDPHIAWDEPRRALKLDELRIDIGAVGRRDALERLRVGDPGVIDAGPVMLANGRLAGRALDNRVGAYIVLEAARRAADRDDRGEIVAVATTQEELGCQGATVSAFALSPGVAIAVDVDYASDGVGAVPERVGHSPLGSGAIVWRSPTIHPAVVELLEQAAQRTGTPYTLKTSNETTETDADVLQISRAGIPTGLVSVPVRSMHTPVEVVQISDIEAAVTMLAEFACSLPPELPAR